MSEKMPLTGKYSVIQIQKFSDSGSIDLPIDIRFVSFLPDKITLEGNNNNTEYEVIGVALNEIEGRNYYYIIASQNQQFLLVQNKEEQSEISKPYFARLTSVDGKEGIMYSLQERMF